MDKGETRADYDARLAAKVESHTYCDLKRWWKHESTSLGDMIAGSNGELSVAQTLGYHANLRKLADMLELMADEYKDADTQRDIHRMHRKADALARFVERVMLPDAQQREGTLVDAAAAPAVKQETVEQPVSVEGRMHWQHMRGGNSMHAGRSHGGGGHHGRTAHGRWH
jgi:hypothetical protein